MAEPEKNEDQAEDDKRPRDHTDQRDRRKDQADQTEDEPGGSEPVAGSGRRGAS
jgi:hypothetical protein